MIKIGILTISDKGSKGEREDLSGKKLKEYVKTLGWYLEGYQIVPDEMDEIVRILTNWCDELKLEVILTTGGTGVSPRDVTPEATQVVLEKEIPGISEYIRFISYSFTPFSALSRGVSGIRGQTLIINLPGSVKAVEEIFPHLVEIIKHAVSKIKGDLNECYRN